jgi:hypothetical protein
MRWLVLLMILVGFEVRSQVPFILEMTVSRVPINHDSPHTENIEKVLLVYVGTLENPTKIGILTSTDTLELHNPNLLKPVYYYKDQKYSFKQYGDWKRGLLIFITPLKPYNRKLWAIVLKSRY